MACSKIQRAEQRLFKTMFPRLQAVEAGSWGWLTEEVGKKIQNQYQTAYIEANAHLSSCQVTYGSGISVKEPSDYLSPFTLLQGTSRLPLSLLPHQVILNVLLDLGKGVTAMAIPMTLLRLINFVVVALTTSCVKNTGLRTIDAQLLALPTFHAPRSASVYT